MIGYVVSPKLYPDGYHCNIIIRFSIGIFQLSSGALFLCSITFIGKHVFQDRIPFTKKTMNPLG
jgi:hypothetical protein